MSAAITKDVGYYLRVYRAKRNLTQAAASRRFRVSPSHWTLLERGHRRPSPLLANLLAKETGAPLRLLLGIQGGLWRFKRTKGSEKPLSG